VKEARLRTPNLNNLVDLLNSGAISKDNTDRCIRICYDAAKIIHLRQKRLGKNRLKMSEISSALALVHFHHTNLYHFDAVGDLAENFGTCDESKALKYYETKVMGTVVDQFKRDISIDEEGMRTLYKERGSGKHIIDTENYEQPRGKRLPWIPHVLRNSRSVYVVDERVFGKFRRSHVYTALASIPQNCQAIGSYFLVVVSEDGNKRLRFLTAYAVDNFNRFLTCIEPGRPWGEI
jgi:hypothetical protein